MTQQQSRIDRYWEIDLLRGTAIIMMVLFHFLYDLNYFEIVSVPVYIGFWRNFAYLTAALFVMIVGISLSISSARARTRFQGREFYSKYLLRGLKIFALGILISVITFLVLGDHFVLFGILHLIGLSIIIAPFFFRFGALNFVFGLFIIIAGVWISGMEGPLWLAWLGVHPATFSSIDYEPLFPWFGLVLIGFALGTLFYPSGSRRYAIPEARNRMARGLSYLGQRSLLIYLVHQPVILGLLALTGSIP